MICYGKFSEMPMTATEPTSKEKLTPIQKLGRKREQLEVQIQMIQARENTKAKSKLTHKKILVGSAVLWACEKGTWDKDGLEKLLGSFLIRTSDRELFEDHQTPTDEDGKEFKASDGQKWKNHVRRQILVGAAVLDSVGKGGTDQDALRSLMDSALARPTDRALFDLQPRVK
jgi:hypothetical protein